MKRVVEKDHKRIYAQASAFRTSRTELLHLAVGLGVFFIIEASSLLRLGASVVATVAGLTALAFLPHELAHKFTAQYHGLRSEFRIDPFGALLSLLSILSPFKIIAPGSVIIFGSVTMDGMGKIALAGPFANLIEVLIFTPLAQVVPLLWYAAVLNADLALFNLLPFSVLDGRKIYLWNKTVWVITFTIVFISWIMLRTIW